jgi:hypothetical protein
MTPFLFAVALVLAPPTVPSYHPMDGQLGAGLLKPLSQPPRSFVKPPVVNTCGKLGAQTVAPDGVKMFKRLDQLPWGVMEHAVWRTVGGCPVREIVFEGQTYYLSSGNPQLQRLDPVVRAPSKR